MLSKLVETGGFKVGPMMWRAQCRHDDAVSEAISAAATAQEEEIRRAFEAGLHDGEARARKHFEARAQQLAAETASALSELAGTRARVIVRAEADVVRLSIEVARRVLHRELSLDPDAIAALVKAALEKLGAQESYRVRAHPDQVSMLRRCLAESRGDVSIQVTGDASLAEGGLLFESEQGTLDASVETQLQEIERGLADQLGERQ